MRTSPWSCVILAWLLLGSQAWAQSAETTGAAAEAAPAPAYTEGGADDCLKCHDEDSEFPVLSVFRTKHAAVGDPRSPFAAGQLQCESCHGIGGAEHGRRLRRGEVRAPIRNFGPGAKTPVAEQIGVCLGCHQGKSRIGWDFSAHASAEVGCADCHQVHAEHDPVMLTERETGVCTTCHSRQKADMFKASSHPLRHGEMSCSGCHRAHDSPSAKLLVGFSRNDACYDCHAEKRGPFLWEHAPAAEDCGLCHLPHGSNQPALLSRRAPLLCQQCHAQAGHPSLTPDPSGIAGATPSRFLLANSCLNCHTQVHGSNHPSGVKLMR